VLLCLTLPEKRTEKMQIFFSLGRLQYFTVIGRRYRYEDEVAHTLAHRSVRQLRRSPVMQTA
jgi:hypothetical protein